MIVYTETGSTYLIDQDDATVMRFAGTPGKTGTQRRDGELVPLLLMHREPVVGEPMVMLLDIRGDGIQTERITSRVAGIEP